jgi:hypothetical protein
MENTFYKKRESKRLVKLYTFIGAIGFTVFLASSIWTMYGMYTNALKDISNFILFIIFVIPLAITFASAIMCQFYLNKRLNYLKAIKLYRENRHFLMLIDMINDNKSLDEVKKFYNEVIIEEYDKTFLNGFALNYYLHSSDEELRKWAESKFESIKESHSICDINFDVF